MAVLFNVALLSLLGLNAATKLADMEQGAKFDKCITIEDWEGKTLADDITLQDRDANGCCPEGSVPGVKHYNSYVGAQVVCGFKADGTVAMSSSTSNSVKTCTNNQCYVWKQNLECSSGNQRLNGCCAAKADCSGGTCGFKTGCKNYAYKNPNNNDAQYCLTYDTNYKMEYTSDKTDDQADNKLQIDKVYQYTKCGGGGGDGGGGGSATASALAWLGSNPSSLLVCQGDCDNDGDCPGASACVQRTNGSPAAVAGCAVGDSGSTARKDTDYCSNPTQVVTTVAPDTETSGAKWMAVGVLGLFLASLAFVENV